MTDVFRRPGMLALPVSVTLWLCAGVVPAQVINVNINGNVATAAPEPRGAFLANRQLTRQYQQASELLDKGDYGVAIPLLQQVIDMLDREEDAFFNADPQRPSQYLSLKGEAERRIGNLPSAGRKAYELRYGPQAQTLAEQAQKRDDLAALESVVRRYFFTRAGHETAERLGNLLMDRGNPLLAAFYFERLRQSPRTEYLNEPYLTLKTAVCWQRAGMSPHAERVLWELRETLDTREIRVGGAKIPMFDRRADALDWLQNLGVTIADGALLSSDWNMFRGDAARDRDSAPVSPLWQGGWSHRALALEQDEFAGGTSAQRLNQIESRLKSLERGLYRELITLPATHPLIVRGRVIFRALGTLSAVDLTTGEMDWEALVPDTALRHLMEGRPQSVPSAGMLVDTFLAQRAWRDLTAGTISSDGRYVFAVDDLGTASTLVGTTGAHPLSPQDYNTLKSFEVDTGRFAWQIGGKPGPTELPLSGHFFLGPPLPLGECLFCLAEYGGEIRLVCLQVTASEGTAAPRPRPEVLWTQSLVLPESDVTRTPLRRQSGISPSYRDGMLICPTTAGAVVGFDPKTRQLMWGYQYDSNQTATPGGVRAIAFARGRPATAQTQPEDEDRWSHSAVILAHGRVLLTPRDSQELHCLDAATGELLWRRPRGQGLYLATVYDRQVVVVGRSHVEAFRLQDGTPAWPRAAETGMPAGQGIRVDSLYHLPAADGTMLTLNLQDGRVLAASRLSDHTLGNLAVADGILVSQSATQVVGFPSVSALQKDIQDDLIADLTDLDALLARAELKLHRGAEDEGLSDLRQVVLLADQRLARGDSTNDTPQPNADEPAAGTAEEIDRVHTLAERARSLIRLTLEQGLLTDFEKYEPHLSELERMLETDDEFAYRRILASGLHDSGRILEAFDEYLNLLDAADGDDALIQVDGARRVRLNRWLEPRVRQLYDSARPEEHLRMQAALNDELDRAVSFDRTETLNSLAECFQVFPASVRARQLLIQQLDAESQLGEVAYQLGRLRSCAERGVAAAATAQLAELYLEHKRATLAVPLIQELEEQWQDVEAQPGRTGREVAMILKSRPEYLNADTQGFQWPDEPLTASTSYNSSTPRTQLVLEVRQTTGRSNGWTYRLDYSLRHLLALDAFGRTVWQMPIMSDGGRRVMVTSRNQDSAAYILEHNQLIVVVLNHRFLVLETLTTGSTPRVLWRDEIGAASTGSATIVMQRIGGARIANVDASGQPMGSVGLVTEDAIVYQNGNRLIAAATRTGKILWERVLVPRGSLIFGDDRHVLINPPGTDQIQVMRLQDGAFLDTVAIPDFDRRLTIQGTRVLSWTTDGSTGTIQMRNAVTGDVTWSREFPAAASFTTVTPHEVAVLRRDGQFELIDTQEGATRLRVQLDPSEQLTGLLVKPSSQQYLVIANEPAGQQNQFGMMLPTIQRAETVNGNVYAIDPRDGTIRWKRRVADQAIDLHQPRDIPAIIFAVSRYRVYQPRAPRTQGNVMILDARNGNIVFNQPATTSSVYYDIQTDTDPPGLTVLVNRIAVRLEFGEQREEVENEKSSDKNSSDKNSSDKAAPDKKRSSGR